MGIRMPEPGKTPEKLGATSVIAITHGHEDHCDIEGMARMPSRSAHVIVPTSQLAATVRKLGYRRVDVVGVWDEITGKDWSLTAVPARAPNAWQEVSYIARLGGVTILHAGDTAMHGSFPEIAERFGPTLGCLPINGVSMLGVRLTMTPLQAARAAALLGLRHAVPIHQEMEFARVSRLLYSARGTEKSFTEALEQLSPGTSCLRAPRGESILIPKILEPVNPFG
jgi:L-ascorbate metabolism protein UlaG (beta-lactamase superfamily)